MLYVGSKAVDLGTITPAQFETALTAIEAGTFIPKNSVQGLAAVNRLITFLTNIQNVTMPALIAQATALKTRNTPV